MEIILIVIIILILIIIIGTNIMYEKIFNNKIKKDFIFDASHNSLHLDRRKDEKINVENLDVSEVNIKSYDQLKLYGKLLIQKNKTDKWMILVHGYGNTHLDCNVQANKFIEENYNLLLIDLRAHGNSEGKYIGMGWPERKDILLWCNYLLKEFENVKIGIYGFSMGASIIMMASGESLPKNVKCLVVDSGYTSVYDQLLYQCKQMYNCSSKILLNIFNVVVKLRTKSSLKEASSIKQLKNNKTPILFIQSDNDTFVPHSMLNELYENTIADKEKLIIKDGGHVCSHLLNPKKYWDTTFKFLNLYMNKE